MSRAFLIVAGAVVMLTTLLAGALIGMSTLFHGLTDEIGHALDGVRAAETATVGLLLHARAEDPVVRGNAEAELRRRLGQLQHEGVAAHEAAAIEHAQERLEAYFVATREHGPRSAEAQSARTDAYVALTTLVEINRSQANALEATLQRWDMLANVIGVGTASIVVALVAALLLWLRLGTVGPVIGFFRAMERFGQGDVEARAPVEGPREVREVAVRFNQMAETLTNQQKATYAFLGGIAHDFRNPLAALSLATHNVREDAPLPPEPRLRKTLALVRRTVGRLERMVGDLVDRARIQAGDLELRFETVDARALASAVTDLYQDTSLQHHIELELPPASVPLNCDPMRIEQVLTNLLSNAIKYSPDGGLIRVRVSDEGEHVRFSVEDQGIGMAPVEAARIFEPFARAAPLRADVPGAGLGLAVVQRIVRGHAGVVRVDSAPGRGSTFTVELPRGGP